MKFLSARAIEPKSRPPMISATIMAPQSQMNAQIRRSLCSWSSRRNTWLCRSEGFPPLPVHYGSLASSGSNETERMLRRPGIQCMILRPLTSALSSDRNRTEDTPLIKLPAVLEFPSSWGSEGGGSS